MNADARLQPHARIAIVGGGPAGSFFALSAFQIAAQLDLPLAITIFERKDLSAPGPRGCNMCAGILSSRTVHGLDALNLALPPDVVMGRINVYTVHWNDHHIPIDPPDATRQVLSVYRSGGPRHSPFAPVTGFDQFLLDQARARGAQVLHERVEKISFASQPRVITSARAEVFDLVVLATGVNAIPPAIENLAYRPPITETMAQDELMLSNPARADANCAVHIFFDHPRDLLFGALIPKGHFVNVSLLGARLDRASIQKFLTDPQVARVVGHHPPQACGCQPRIAASPAHNFFADRFIAIGDACVTRLYKDGIGSALMTARAAAETALTRGIHRAAFAAQYAPVCRAIARDNRLGRAVFALTGASRQSPLLMRTLARALAAEARQAPRDRLTSQVLWSLFTGDADYSEIFKMMLHPQRIARLGFAMLEEILRKKTK
jgi:flavin-dependent dehydrogenase